MYAYIRVWHIYINSIKQSMNVTLAQLAHIRVADSRGKTGDIREFFELRAFLKKLEA